MNDFIKILFHLSAVDGMVGTHAERVVDTFIKGDYTIDTAMVTDAELPYETAISHPAYNGGEWVVLEEYETKTNAKKGHAKWVELFTSSEPQELTDVSTAEWALAKDRNVGGGWRVKPRRGSA